MRFAALPPLLCGTVALTVGILLLTKRPLPPVRRALALLCLITAHWQACWLATYFISEPAQKDILMRVAWTPIMFIPVTFYDFATAFLSLPRERRLVSASYCIAGAFLLPLWIGKTFLSRVQDFWWGYYPIGGPLHSVYLIGALLLMVRALVLLRREAVRPDLSSTERNRRRFAFLIFFTYFFTAPEYLINYGVPIYPVGPITLTSSFLLATYAITRHQLLDVRLVITRTGLFLTVYLVVLGAPLLVGWLGQEPLQSALGTQWWLVPVGLCMALASVGPFIYGYLRRQTEQHLLQELARANVDALTGSLTRRSFEERAGFELSACLQGRQPCGLLMIDLDHFKAKNDQHGHLIGDAVLQEVGRRLGQALRHGDLLGRYGGEEFIILLPRADRAQTATIAERLRETVASHPVPTEAGPIGQTLSIGLAVCPDDGEQMPSLIGSADQALYEAKHAGRNRVVPHAGGAR